MNTMVYRMKRKTKKQEQKTMMINMTKKIKIIKDLRFLMEKT